MRSRRASPSPRARRSCEAAGALARENPDAYHADPSRRELAEIAFVKQQFPWARDLSRRLRALWPARAALDLRPLHSSRRIRGRGPRGQAGRSPPSARPRTCFSAPACSTSGGSMKPACASRWRPTSAAAPAIRCCDRQRSLQGAADERPVLAGRAGLLPDDAGQRARARRWRIASARSRRAARPTSWCSTRARPRRWRIGWRRATAKSRRSCSC